MIMISILTPTYNRAYTLTRLFDSLVAQSEASFEWVVVDDGSTDNTAELLGAMKDLSLLNMRVVSQPNSGKHVAINSGVEIANGGWVFIVDSDDFLTFDAVSKIRAFVERDLCNDTVGVCYRRGFFDFSLIGSHISQDLGCVSYMHPTQAGQLYNGDLAYVFRRSALLAHPFPVFEREKFVPELLVWNKLGDNGKIAYHHHDIIYLCEYLPDGLSANFDLNLKSNPRAFGVFYRQQFFREDSLVRKLKCAIRALQCLYFSVVRGSAQ